MKDSIEVGVFLMGKNKNTVSNKSKNDNFSPTKSTEISFLGTRKRGEKKVAGCTEAVDPLHSRGGGSLRGEWEPKSRVAARTPITPCLIRVRLARSRAISHGEFVLLPVHSKNRQKRFESSADRRPSQFPGSNVSSRFPIEQLLFFDHSPFNPLSSYLHTLYFSFNTNILAVITGSVCGIIDNCSFLV